MTQVTMIKTDSICWSAVWLCTSKLLAPYMPSLIMQWELALQLFSSMHRDGCKPNTITYNSLITACAQGV